MSIRILEKVNSSVLLILDGARSTRGGTSYSFHAHEYPVHLGELIADKK